MIGGLFILLFFFPSCTHFKQINFRPKTDRDWIEYFKQSHTIPDIRLVKGDQHFRLSSPSFDGDLLQGKLEAVAPFSLTEKKYIKKKEVPIEEWEELTNTLLIYTTLDLEAGDIALPFSYVKNFKRVKPSPEKNILMISGVGIVIAYFYCLGADCLNIHLDFP